MTLDDGVLGDDFPVQILLEIWVYTLEEVTSSDIALETCLPSAATVELRQ